MSTPSKISLLWHDDELDGARTPYVAIWRTWFDRRAASIGAVMRCTSTLREFSSALQAAKPRFDLLVIDVMLKREPDTNFSSFGFARERILRLDAGAQIAGLLRNGGDFERNRSDWLKSYASTPIVLLSSTPTVVDLLKHYVDADRRDGVLGLVKSVGVHSRGICVASEFEEPMNAVLASLIAQPRAGHS